MTAQVRFCPVCRQSNAPDSPECVACDAPIPASGWPEDPHVGKVLGGKYRVDSRLGAGGFGTVLLATQLHGHQDLGQVVLKILHADLAQQQNVRRRFENEARAVRRLGSPHVVKVFDLCYDDQAVPFIVMEYLEGQSLADVLEDVDRLPLGRVLSIARQIAEALAECHAKEIIHRDLKPDNILLLGGHREDFVKILDFGIARVPSPTGRVTQTLMGTPMYMPPEQIHQQDMDHRVDIFALGVILFECLTGAPPIKAPSHVAYLTQNCEVAPARLRSVLPEAPVPLDALLDRLMAKAAADRPANMEEVAAVVAELESSVDGGLMVKPAARAGGAPTTGPKLTTLSASTGTQELALSLRRSNRSPWRYVAVGAIAMVSVVAMAYWQLGGPSGGPKAGRGGPGGMESTGAGDHEAVDAMVRGPGTSPMADVSGKFGDGGVSRRRIHVPSHSRPPSAMRPAQRRRVVARPVRPVMAPVMRVGPRLMRPPDWRPMAMAKDDPFGRVR